MPIQIPYRLLTIFLISLCPLLMSRPAYTQDEAPAPQFLFRDGNHLVLVNGYTGETSQLPFAVSDNDYFSWSPDGKYLQVLSREDSADYTFCLNLYDVDALAWLYDEPLACAVKWAIFSLDSTRLVYITTDGLNGALWLYNLADETTQEIYQAESRNKINRAGIGGMQWSPAETYLTFEVQDWVMGGSLNRLVVMNVADRTSFTVNARSSYYAYYHPIWSQDENWFLIILKEQYATSGPVATNDAGDIYLVNTATGEKVRVTYTPTVSEYDVGWTEDGQITFKQIQETILTLEQALNVPEVLPEDIVTPEPVDYEILHYSPHDVVVSPDTNVAAWIKSEGAGLNDDVLYVGLIAGFDSVFNRKLPESYQIRSIVIGWRPSNYPYPPG